MKRYHLYLLGLLLLINCKEPYESPVISSGSRYLVVEGVLNSGGTTTIKLSRTTSLKDTTAVAPELRAKVSVESENSSSYALIEQGKGIYTAALQNIITGNRYRMRIKTAAGKEYLSDFVAARPAPQIDSVSWRRENGGVQVYVNTHDPSNNTRYYRWEFEETWEFHTLRSLYKYVPDLTGGKIIARDTSKADRLPTVCWQTFKSQNVLIGTSAKLEKDIISLYPLSYIPQKSWKMSVKYSILVRQYALSREAFEYWQGMKKNTEQLGSVFDPQPSEIKGNIHGVSDPQEVVVGYFDVCQVRESRRFIENSALPGWNFEICQDMAIPPPVGPGDIPKSIGDYFGGGNYIPTGTEGTGARKECVDCRIRGTDVKPAFW